MGHLGKGLAALMGNEPVETPSAAQRAGIKSIDDMPMLELMYQMCKGDGLELVGDPSRAFAAFDSAAGKLRVYSKNNEHVDMVPYDTSTMIATLEYARTHDASFMVSDDKVICVLKGVTARGNSYPEAALRALAKYQISAKPQ